MKLFIRHARKKHNLKGAAIVGLIVGTVLTAINHYDMFLSGNYELRRFVQIILTYFVPFFVSLHGRAIYGRLMES